MNEDALQLVKNMKRTLLYLIISIAVVAGAVYAAGYMKTACGILVGMFTGGLYFFLMSYRIGKAVQMPKTKAVGYMRTGWWVRLSFVLLALVFSAHFVEVNFWAVVAGLFSLHFIIIINAFVIAFRDCKKGF